MQPFLGLPFPGGTAFASRAAAGTLQANSALLVAYTRPVFAMPPSWAVTTTISFYPTLRLVGPGEQMENQEEGEDDLELESDEQSKLRIARACPGTEEGSPAAWSDVGTINPPFP